MRFINFCPKTIITTKILINKVENEILIFLHIPKAGGSTLSSIITHQFNKEAVFKIGGGKTKDQINKFLNLSEKEKQKYDCLIGHFPFGIHRYVTKNPVYITMLRHPVDRLVSDYCYIYHTPNHSLHNKIINGKITLHDHICEHINNNWVNLQTRLLSGYSSLSDYGPPWNNWESLDKKALVTAKENLKKYFKIVGATERFDESLLLMKNELGWEKVYYRRKNITKKRPKLEKIPYETIKLIEESNKLDINLYNFVYEMLEKRINSELSLKDIIKFQKINRMRNILRLNK